MGLFYIFLLFISPVTLKQTSTNTPPLSAKKPYCHYKKETNMLYSMIGEDVPNSLNDRLEARPAHLARLEVLHNEGRLVLAGPNPSIDSDNPGNAGFSGSVVVAEFATLEDAQTWADADPYVDAGVYQKVTVKPFKQVFPKI